MADVNISVVSLAGRHVASVNLLPGSEVRALRDCVSQACGSPPPCIRLLYGDVVLDALDVSLFDASVADGAVVTLIIAAEPKLDMAYLGAGHVHGENGDWFDCMLSQCNVQANTNKFYIIQIVQNEDCCITQWSEYCLFTRWGRVGEQGQCCNSPMQSLEEAKAAFRKKFMDKTNNDWDKRVSFSPQPGKYSLVETEPQALPQALLQQDKHQLPSSVSAGPAAGGAAHAIDRSMVPTFQDPADFVEPIRRLHAQIRSAVLEACERQAVESMSAVVAEDLAGDTTYAIDRVSEEVLLEFVAREIAPSCPVLLVAEGLPDNGEVVLPAGTARADARYAIIVDPIDGTRGLMYQKRSAWILTGVAPLDASGSARLQDVATAVMTEVPTVKSHLCDVLWAVRGRGAEGRRVNRLDGSSAPLPLRPSTAKTLAHGFATVSRFFPGAKVELSSLDEAIVHASLGPVQRGKALCFEDQYICSGGQLYELIIGHDRFVCDVRPLAEQLLAARGLELGLCAHPYDLCTVLIAEEVGVVITGAKGEPLDCPLDCSTDVSWVGYANASLRESLEPVLIEELARWSAPLVTRS